MTRQEAIHAAAEINRTSPDQYRKVAVRTNMEGPGYVIHCIDHENKIWVVKNHGEAFSLDFQNRKAG